MTPTLNHERVGERTATAVATSDMAQPKQKTRTSGAGAEDAQIIGGGRDNPAALAQPNGARLREPRLGRTRRHVPGEPEPLGFTAGPCGPARNLSATALGRGHVNRGLKALRAVGWASLGLDGWALGLWLWGLRLGLRLWLFWLFTFGLSGALLLGR